MVAWECMGQLIETQTVSHTGAVEPELAVAVGIRKALSWMKQKRCNNLLNKMRK